MSSVTLWLDPPSHHFERDRLFDVGSAPFSGEDILTPYARLRSTLRSQGVGVHTADLLDTRRASDAVDLYVSTGTTKRFRGLARRGDVILSAFIVLECPLVARDMFGQLPEASRHFRRMVAYNDGSALSPFLKAPIAFETIRYPYPFDGVHERAWSNTDRSFLAVINGNKAVPSSKHELYTERLRAIDFFARTNEVDLYGVGWDGPPYRVGRRAWIPGTIRREARRAANGLNRLHPDPLLATAQSVWRGQVKSKPAVLSRYRFSICIENQPLEGWVTEKIFDSIRAGCVPIYLGAPDVEQWVPPDSFIDMRAFEGYAELRCFLQSVSDRELQEYRDAGREFLASERFAPFRTQTFVDRIARIVSEDAGVEIGAVAAI